MVKYLSLDWIDSLSTVVAADDNLKQHAAGLNVGITQVVTDCPDGTVTYHLQVRAGEVAFGVGPADPEHVRFEQSWDTAVGVATGTINAQNAFISGQIRLYGDRMLLLEAQSVLGALNGVFDQVRADTDYGV